jgi:hypothetical protein
MEEVFLTTFKRELRRGITYEPRASERKLLRYFDLQSRDEIVEALKYLKDNKAADSDSMAAELLKSGGPSLVNALNEMIQQVWIGETLPESWTEGVLCSVYKKGDKLDCKNYRGICLLNLAAYCSTQTL